MAGTCCWRPVTQTATVFTGPGEPTLSMTGTVTLHTYPDCIEPYNGDYRADLAYLVGWGTDNERLFRSNKAKAAIAYANTFNPHLPNSRVALTQLCTRAVEDLYALTQ